MPWRKVVYRMTRSGQPCTLLQPPFAALHTGCAWPDRSKFPSTKRAKIECGEMANRTPDLSKVSKDANGMLYQLNHIPIHVCLKLSINILLCENFWAISYLIPHEFRSLTGQADYLNQFAAHLSRSYPSSVVGPSTAFRITCVVLP
jgi:hypothetical protein